METARLSYEPTLRLSAFLGIPGIGQPDMARGLSETQDWGLTPITWSLGLPFLLLHGKDGL